MNKGFTLIEITVAIVIMTIGIVGIYSLVPKITSVASTNNNNFIASQLAKEGAEIIRNIRDGNWLSDNNFDNELTNGDYLIQYNSQTPITYADQFLKIDSSGFYNYEEGENTKFKRKIIISHPEVHILNVKVQVSWLGKGSPFEVQNELYDWK